MNILLVAIQFYLALITLGTSGLAKLDNIELFLVTLKRQGLVPPQFAKLLAYTLPWSELVIAVLLILNLFPVITSLIVLIMFLGFCIVKLTLFLKKARTSCGCGGDFDRKPVDSASLTTTLIQLLLAITNLTLTTIILSDNLPSRILSISLIIGLSLWSFWRIHKRTQQRQRDLLVN